jgi:hypothetical protein
MNAHTGDLLLAAPHHLAARAWSPSAIAAGSTGEMPNCSVSALSSATCARG